MVSESKKSDVPREPPFSYRLVLGKPVGHECSIHASVNHDDQLIVHFVQICMQVLPFLILWLEKEQTNVPPPQV